MSEEATTEEVVEATEATTEATPEVEGTAEEKAFVDSMLELMTDEEIKDHKMWDNLKGKDADELGRYVKELKSFAGKKGDIPKSLDEGGTEDEWNEFFSKLGRPETIEGYEFSLNSEFKEVVGEEQLPFYNKVVDTIKEQAFNLGASPEMAEKALDSLLDLVASEADGAKKVMEERASENDKALRTEWGDKYDGIYTGIKAMLKNNGMTDEQVSWAEQAGILKEPSLAVALGKISDKFGDDPQIGHHQTQTVSGLHDQLAEVNHQVAEYIKIGNPIPQHIAQKRIDIMNKLGENL